MSDFTDDMYECRPLVDPANNGWKVIPCAEIDQWPVNMAMPRFSISAESFEALLRRMGGRSTR